MKFKSNFCIHFSGFKKGPVCISRAVVSHKYSSGPRSWCGWEVALRSDGWAEWPPFFKGGGGSFLLQLLVVTLTERHIIMSSHFAWWWRTATAGQHYRYNLLQYIILEHFIKRSYDCCSRLKYWILYLRSIHNVK